MEARAGEGEEQKESNLHNILYTISLLLAIFPFYEASEVVKKILLPRMLSRPTLPDHALACRSSAPAPRQITGDIMHERVKNSSGQRVQFDVDKLSIKCVVTSRVLSLSDPTELHQVCLIIPDSFPGIKCRIAR